MNRPDIRGLRLCVPDILNITVWKAQRDTWWRRLPLEPEERGLSVAGTVGLTGGHGRHDYTCGSGKVRMWWGQGSHRSESGYGSAKP